MRVVLGLLAVIGAMLASVACGSNSSSPVTVTPSAAQTTELSGKQEYQSVQALADDLTKFGHSCSPAPVNNDFAVQAGKCSTDVGELRLSIYDSQPSLEAQLQFVKSNFTISGSDYGWLVGNRWSIDCGTRSACETLQANLGGKVAAPTN